MNINNYTRGRTVIKNKLFFAGGYPKFRWLPKTLKWGKNISLYWLGTELVFKTK